MQNTDSPDFYRVLGLTPDASDEDIKKKYRKLARKYHPDIAGDDPVKAERFADIKRAYEVLSDPDLRTAYDNRNSQRPSRNRRFHRSSWRMPGAPRQEARPKSDRFKKRRWADPANHISIDEMFGSEESASDGQAGAFNQGTYERGDTPGEDIALPVSVQRSILTNGGTVMVEYQRLIRTPQGSMVPYDEIYALRIPPGTRNGSTLRGDRYGHDSPDGGRAGDLICDIVVVPDMGQNTETSKETASFDGFQGGASPASSRPVGGGEANALLNITISEAVLGGRVSVQTPAGKVVVGIPPRTSSGQRLRLKGKGANGADWIVATRIVVPQHLDAESEDLIRRFAMLNPDSVED